MMYSYVGKIATPRDLWNIAANQNTLLLRVPGQHLDQPDYLTS